MWTFCNWFNFFSLFLQVLKYYLFLTTMKMFQNLLMLFIDCYSPESCVHLVLFYWNEQCIIFFSHFANFDWSVYNMIFWDLIGWLKNVWYNQWNLIGWFEFDSTIIEIWFVKFFWYNHWYDWFTEKWLM